MKGVKMHIRMGGTSLAVEAQADVVVAGASFAGCAAALAAAWHGLKVVLVESRTYPGYEAAALYRPWMDAAARRDTPDLMKPWLRAASRPTGSDLALHPDGMKRGIEDVLIGAGVKLYYASQPVGVVRESGRIAGIVIANKSGRQVVLARAVVDATEWGLIGRLAGMEFELRRPVPCVVNVRRTIEFTGASSARQCAGSDWTVREGYLGSGHVLLECPMNLEMPSVDVRGLMKIEFESRRRTMALVERARKYVPGLRKAYFANASFELALPSPFVARRPEGFGFATGGRDGNVVVLGTAAAAGASESVFSLLEPLSSTRLGEIVGPRLLLAVERVAPPVADKCVAECGFQGGAGARNAVVREPDGPQRGREYRRVRTRRESIPVLADCDVVVVGGGTAGAVAAPVAAAEGVSTSLLEMCSGLGGTGTIGGINTYWFGRKEGFTAEVDRRYRSVAKKIGATRFETDHLADLPASGNWHVEAKMHALLEWSLENGVDAFFRVTTVGALVDRGTVKGVLVATPDGLAGVRSRVVIEATGDADVVAFAGGKTVHGAARDRIPLMAGFGPLPAPGVPTNNFATFVNVGDINDYTRFILAGRRRFLGYDHSPYVAPRESRHIKGLYTVSLEDQLTFKRHDDLICFAFDGRDLKGISSADWAMWGLSCGKINVEIPYRALVPEKLDGLIVGSKAYSATHEGTALARMQPDMQNLGGVAALAAVQACRRGVSLRRVDVRALQRDLARRGHFPPALMRKRSSARRLTDRAIVRVIDGLDGNELAYASESWMDPQWKADPVAVLCAAGKRIVPHLKRAHARANGEKRLLLARLLAWYGSSAAVPTLLERIRADLSGGKLPALHVGKKWRHSPPDNTKMTMTCRLVYSLGLTRHPSALDVIRQVVRLLRCRSSEYANDGNGCYYYVQIVCLVAEYLGRPEAVPILSALHAKPGLHGLKTTTFQSGIMDERMGYLEVAIGRALARCGSAKGLTILAGYLDDARAHLAEHAHRELQLITGRDFGKNGKKWSRHIRRLRGRLKPRPWRTRSES